MNKNQIWHDVLNNKSNLVKGTFVFPSAAEQNNCTLDCLKDFYNLSKSSLFFTSWGSSGSLFLLLVLVFILWFNECPFLLLLNCELEWSVGVASAIVANASVPPKLVDGEGQEDYVRVVQFMIVTHPGADEAPGSLNGWVGTKAGHFFRFAA